MELSSHNILLASIEKLNNCIFKTYLLSHQKVKNENQSKVSNFKLKLFFQEFLWLFFFKDFIYLFLERGREGEREGEKHWCVRDTTISCLSRAPTWGPSLQPRHVPWLGMNGTGDLSVLRHALNPLSHPATTIFSLFFISPLFFCFYFRKQGQLL